MLTQQEVIDLFEYRDGNLHWRKALNKRIRIGDRAGTISSTGYIAIMIGRKRYQAHRLIFLLHYGWLPEFIDHMDRNRINNRIENLRAATKAQNQRNTPVRRDSSSGAKNVCWSHKLKKWVVRLRINNKPTHIGVFEDKDLAIFVASEYRDKYHGEFARHG